MIENLTANTSGCPFALTETKAEGFARNLRGLLRRVARYLDELPVSRGSRGDDLGTIQFVNLVARAETLRAGTAVTAIPAIDNEEIQS
jgi:hypothetical protein